MNPFHHILMPAAWRRVVASAAALAVAGCMSAPARPVSIWLGAVSAPDVPTITKSVESWEARRFNGLVRQQTDFSCGAAVLATIFNSAYGRSTTEQQVLLNMLQVADPDIVREKGFSLLDMKKYVQAIGMKGEGYEVDYAMLGKLDVPTIVLINIKGYKHFVIVRKVYRDEVSIGDPALGNRLMSRADFDAAWNNVAFVVMGDGYDPGNSLLDPPEALSARRLLEQHARLPAAEAAEFGFAPRFSLTL